MSIKVVTLYPKKQVLCFNESMSVSSLEEADEYTLMTITNTLNQQTSIYKVCEKIEDLKAYIAS